MRRRPDGKGPHADPPAEATALAALLQGRASVARVVDDVATLAVAPRDRHQPHRLRQARGFVTRSLTDAGWRVSPTPFERRWVVGVDDSGAHAGFLRRLRLFRRLYGINLVADLPGAPPGRRVLLVAHLDSVPRSPGADDNASGVAALLEAARLLATLPEPPAVTLAVVDLEELGKVGSGALARDRAFRQRLDLVVCLESVGTFTDVPGTQRMGGLALVFRDLARQVAAVAHRGNFLLAVCRSSSARAARTVAVAAAALDGPLPVFEARDPRPDGWPGRLMTWLLPLLAHLDRSDHAPFWSRGVPAIMLTTTASFRNRHYHLEGDVPDNVDCERVTRVAVAVAAAAAVRFGLPDTGKLHRDRPGDPSPAAETP